MVGYESVAMKVFVLFARMKIWKWEQKLDVFSKHQFIESAVTLQLIIQLIEFWSMAGAEMITSTARSKNKSF